MHYCFTRNSIAFRSAAAAAASVQTSRFHRLSSCSPALHIGVFVQGSLPYLNKTSSSRQSSLNRRWEWAGRQYQSSSLHSVAVSDEGIKNRRLVAVVAVLRLLSSGRVYQTTTTTTSHVFIIPLLVIIARRVAMVMEIKDDCWRHSTTMTAIINRRPVCSNDGIRTAAAAANWVSTRTLYAN